MKDLSILDEKIYGRVEPHIYAFSTNMIPDYLKIGDTYRPVSITLNEWKEIYKDLKKEFEEVAMVDQDTFFRDYSVHQYLENELKKERINTEEYPNDIYISNEFFKVIK